MNYKRASFPGEPLSLLYMKKQILLFISACILTLAACSIVLRFVLFDMAYEYDELFTAITADPSLSLKWIYLNWLIVDVHPPLYNILMWCYTHFCSYGPELWLRLPSLIFGMGALFCSWYFFPKHFGKSSRLLFTAWIGCNTYMILYSQQARSYSLVLLLSVCLTFCFLNMVRTIFQKKPISLGQWGIFAGLALMLEWCHYFGTLLVGVFCAFLFVFALKNKQKLKFFIMIPLGLGIACLPWLIPNFLMQLKFQRLGGNWWANTYSLSDAPAVFLRIFFYSFWGKCWGGILFFVGLIGRILRYKRTGSWGPYFREITVLGGVLAVVFCVTFAISFKTYMFVGRYFTVVLPAGYLLLILLWKPLYDKYLLMKLACVVVLSLELLSFVSLYKVLKEPNVISSRIVSQFYRDYLKNREIMVVAMEAFPPSAMPAMYGFYVNKVYGLNVRITELFSLSEQERDKYLKKQDKAFVYMPNCSEEKLYSISRLWNRQVEIYMRLGETCILHFNIKGSGPLDSYEYQQAHRHKSWFWGYGS